MTILILGVVCLIGGFLGADSRPLDVEQLTRWWPTARQ